MKSNYLVYSLNLTLLALSLQACSRAIYTSQLAAPKVSIQNMGPNIQAGQTLNVNYTAVVPVDKEITQIEVSQKLANDSEFKVIQVIAGNPGTFTWTAPEEVQSNAQIQVKATDNRMSQGISARSALINIVQGNTLTEVISATSPPTAINNGNGTYGGECTLGYSVRASIIITQHNSCIPLQPIATVVSCVDDGTGIGRWSYQFDGLAVNNNSINATFNFIFDIYDPNQQLPFEAVMPIGRVWGNESSGVIISAN